MKDIEKDVPTIDLNKIDQVIPKDQYGPMFEDGYRWGRYPKTSHWLECNTDCDGIYDFDPEKVMMVCQKCGHEMKAEVANDGKKLKFGGMTSFGGRRSFYLHIRPGDRIQIYKQYRDGKTLQESVNEKKEQKVCKDFQTFKLGGKKIDFVQVNFYVDVTVALLDEGEEESLENYRAGFHTPGANLGTGMNIEDKE